MNRPLAPPTPPRAWIAPALLMAALAAGLCVNLRAPLFGSMEPQGAYQALAARNHLRYGLCITKGFPNHSPQGLDGEDFERHWFVNHPPLSALYTAAFFAVFGESLVTVRLSGIVWAVLALPVVWYVGRKLAPAAGTWCALLYAAAGVVLWDARRPMYFQPELFFMMAALAFYVAWREKPSAPRWAGVVASAMLAAMMDWPAYLLGAALAVHLGVTEGRRRWLQGLTLLGGIAVTFALFLLHVRWAVGDQGISTLKTLFVARTTEGSRLAAALIMAKAMLTTHVGVVATLAALAGLILPRLLPPSPRKLCWTLAAYGLLASQFFLSWTAGHAYVAAWFAFPAIVVAGGLGLAALGDRISSPFWRRAMLCLLALGAISQGAFVAAFRHRQTTWYGPDKEVIALIQRNVPPGAWVASPIRGLAPVIPTYETDCNFFWSVTTEAELREILRRGRRLYVLVPRPESEDGFWKTLSPGKREEFGVRRLEPAAQDLVNLGDRRELGAYELYILDP